MVTPLGPGAPPPSTGSRELGGGGGAPWRRRCRPAATEGSGGRGAAGGCPDGASRVFPGLRISPGAAAPRRAVAVRGGRGLRLGLCRERPPGLGGPGGAPGGSGAGPPPRRRAGAGAALHPPPLPLAAGGRPLRRPPEPPRSAESSDLTLCPQPRDPRPNKTLRAAVAVLSVSGGTGGVSGCNGGDILGAPRPRTGADAPAPLPRSGQPHPKLCGAGGVPSAGAPVGFGRGSRGSEGAVGAPRGGRGRLGASRCPLGLPGPPPGPLPLSLSAAAPPRPEGSRGGSEGVPGGLRERSRVPVRHPRLGTAMDVSPSCSALVPPLLLLLALPTLGSCCSFGFNPISSTFSAHLNNLIPWLLLDYPVVMPSNLEPDSACSDLWGLHFGALALQRMLGVAGKDLAPLLRTLLAQLHFVAECHIQDPQGCVRLEKVNVSQLLETLTQHLGGLQGRPPHFPGCARLRCRPGPALSSPAVRHEGTLGARQGPPSPAGHGLVLLGGVGGALGLVAAVWALWRRPCAQAGLSHW